MQVYCHEAKTVRLALIYLISPVWPFNSSNDLVSFLSGCSIDKRGLFVKPSCMLA